MNGMIVEWEVTEGASFGPGHEAAKDIFIWLDALARQLEDKLFCMRYGEGSADAEAAWHDMPDTLAKLTDELPKIAEEARAARAQIMAERTADGATGEQA